tara:strand:- start:28335 stop:28580 length:246 start_codon:yes stop_codon:yes gene_type:complete
MPKTIITIRDDEARKSLRAGSFDMMDLSVVWQIDVWQSGDLTGRMHKAYKVLSMRRPDPVCQGRIAPYESGKIMIVNEFKP